MCVISPFYIISTINCNDYQQYPDTINQEECANIDSIDTTTEDNYYYVALKADVRITQIIETFYLWIGVVILAYFVIGYTKVIDKGL